MEQNVITGLIHAEMDFMILFTEILFDKLTPYTCNQENYIYIWFISILIITTDKLLQLVMQNEKNSLRVGYLD